MCVQAEWNKKISELDRVIEDTKKKASELETRQQKEADESSAEGKEKKKKKTKKEKKKKVAGLMHAVKAFDFKAQVRDLLGPSIVKELQQLVGMTAVKEVRNFFKKAPSDVFLAFPLLLSYLLTYPLYILFDSSELLQYLAICFPSAQCSPSNGWCLGCGST